jgi:hypothetical protein
MLRREFKRARHRRSRRLRVRLFHHVAPCGDRTIDTHRQKDPRLLCQGSAIALGTARSVEEVALDAHRSGESIHVFDAVEASRPAEGVGLEHGT